MLRSARRFSVVAAGLNILLLWPVNSVAQEVGTLTGVVTGANSAPLARARVTIAGTALATATDSGVTPSAPHSGSTSCGTNLGSAPDNTVPALTTALADTDPEVRREAATALGSFGAAAVPALPALRKTSGDANEDVAREAGRAIIRVQQK